MGGQLDEQLASLAALFPQYFDTVGWVF